MKHRLFGILGHPVCHSASPAWHEPRFETAGLDARYLKFDVAPEDLGAALSGLRAIGVEGLNITVPHKAAVRDHLAAEDQSVSLAGAANCLRLESDGWHATNTDSRGLLKDLRTRGQFDPRGKRVAVIGIGGAGRAVAATLANSGVSHLRLYNRDESKTESLAKQLEDDTEVRARPWNPEAWNTELAYIDLVVMAGTPAVNGSLTSFDPTVLAPDALYVDLNYYEESPLAAAVTAAQRQFLDGSGMLDQQARLSWRHWFGPDVVVPD